MKNNQGNIIVIGIGNTLYTDEGLGIHILPYVKEALKQNGLTDVEVYEGSTDSMSLLAPIDRADYLLVVDAIKAGKAPGEIIALTEEEIPKYFSTKLSVHQVGFQEVLFAARLLEQLPKEMAMIGAQPYSLELGVELSKGMKEKLPKMLDMIVAQVKRWRA